MNLGVRGGGWGLRTDGKMMGNEAVLVNEAWASVGKAAGVWEYGLWESAVCPNRTDVSHSACPQTLSVSQSTHTSTHSHAGVQFGVAFFELFTDPDSTMPQHKPCALWLTITFPLAGPDGPHTHNVETAGKVRKQPVEFVTVLSQWLELRDGTLWWLYHHDELIFRRCVMPYGVQNEDITHTHKPFTLCSHNVPAWTQHAEAATLNIFLIHIETQNGNWNKAQ